MMPLYAGIGGVVRELKEMDAGINGVVTPLTEMWAGVGGVNRQIFSAGGTNAMVVYTPEKYANYFSETIQELENGDQIKLLPWIIIGCAPMFAVSGNITDWSINSFPDMTITASQISYILSQISQYRAICENSDFSELQSATVVALKNIINNILSSLGLSSTISTNTITIYSGSSFVVSISYS